MAQLTPALLQTIEFEIDQKTPWPNGIIFFGKNNHEIVASNGAMYIDETLAPSFDGLAGYDLNYFNGIVTHFANGSGTALDAPLISGGNVIAVTADYNFGVGQPLYANMFYGIASLGNSLGSGAPRFAAGLPLAAIGIQYSGFFANRPGALGGTQTLCFYSRCDDVTNSTHKWYFIEVDHLGASSFSSASFPGAPLSSFDLVNSGVAIEAGGAAYIFAGPSDNITRVARNGAITENSFSVFNKGANDYRFCGSFGEGFFYWDSGQQRGREISKDGASYIEYVNRGDVGVYSIKKGAPRSFPNLPVYALVNIGGNNYITTIKNYVTPPPPISSNGNGGNPFNFGISPIIDLPCFHTCDIFAKKG